MIEELMEGYEEIDELGNRWVYNPKTGFLEHAPPEKKPEIPITDFAHE